MDQGEARGFSGVAGVVLEHDAGAGVGSDERGDDRASAGELDALDGEGGQEYAADVA